MQIKKRTSSFLEMNLQRFLFSTAIISLLLGSCADEISQIPDVYVAGETVAKGGKYVATYWKNQKEIPLTQDTTGNTFANSIALDGNDVYVVGFQQQSFKNDHAIFWKNGIATSLADDDRSSYANAITIVNGDVYIAGAEEKAAYWKNGQLNLLDGDEATSIFVVENDVYVAGFDYSGSAKYWINGFSISLTNGTMDARANGIAVVGKDVYVVGYEDRLAKYWKNGVAFTLTSKDGEATGIALQGNDVYIVGYENSNTQFFSIVKYWKNGVEVVLTDESQSCIARAITVNNKDVFVAGSDFYNAKYWKNNQSFDLLGLRKSISVNSVHSIFVK